MLLLKRDSNNNLYCKIRPKAKLFCINQHNALFSKWLPYDQHFFKFSQQLNAIDSRKCVIKYSIGQYNRYKEFNFLLPMSFKDRVYRTPPQNIDDLRKKIQQEAEILRGNPALIRRVLREIQHRSNLCVVRDGGHVENL